MRACLRVLLLTRDQLLFLSNTTSFSIVGILGILGILACILGILVYSQEYTRIPVFSRIHRYSWYSLCILLYSLVFVFFHRRFPPGSYSRVFFVFLRIHILVCILVFLLVFLCILGILINTGIIVYSLYFVCILGILAGILVVFLYVFFVFVMYSTSADASASSCPWSFLAQVQASPPC